MQENLCLCDKCQIKITANDVIFQIRLVTFGLRSEKGNKIWKYEIITSLSTTARHFGPICHGYDTDNK